jgi:hypothetical protein
MKPNCLVLLTMMAAAAPALGQTIDVQTSVFGVTTRTPYCTRDGVNPDGTPRWVPTFWLMDDIIPNGPNRDWIIRYTTMDSHHPLFCDPTSFLDGDGPQLPQCHDAKGNPAEPTGNMSVYERDGNMIYVVAEHRIWSNSNGEPVRIRDIQWFNPRKVFSPTSVPVPTQQPPIESVGQYSYCVVGGSKLVWPGKDELCTPTLVKDSDYHYWLQIVAQTGLPYFQVHENYQQFGDGAWAPPYGRSFRYSPPPLLGTRAAH